MDDNGRPNVNPIGVTIVSPAYRRLARQAVRRFQLFTGLEVKVIECANKDGFQTKLELDKHCGRRPIVFFDADLWLLRSWDPVPLMGGPCWVACHDSAVWNPGSFCHRDCEKNGLDRLHYINTGLFICDLRRLEHRGIFQSARASVRSKRTKTADASDQFHINRALLTHGVQLSFLHPRHNFYSLSVVWGQYPNYPREIIGIHAAGVALKHKWDTLMAEASIFGRPHNPMCPEAVNWFFTKANDLP